MLAKHQVKLKILGTHFLKKDILRYEIPKIHFLTDFENEKTVVFIGLCSFQKKNKKIKNGVVKETITHRKPQNSEFFPFFNI